MSHVTTIGLNHSTAPIETRERVAIDTSRLPAALRSATQALNCTEILILSTCNRTEVTVLEPFHTTITTEQVAKWFAAFFDGVDSEHITPHLYHHTGPLAVKHAFRVAAGLDSLIVGEPQILGQLKNAFSAANNCKTIGPNLNRLFQSAFAVAKRVRTDTDIGQCPVSVAYAAVAMAKRIFSDLSETRVLLIGAGDMIELVAKHLQSHQPQSLTIANRTLDHAKTLAESVSGHAKTLREIPMILAEADIVVSCTASPLPIIGKGLVESIMKQRKQRPMMIVDIAVPRDVEADVHHIENVYLYTVDDLTNAIDENLENRRAAAEQAETMIQGAVTRFLETEKSLEVVDTIRAFRHHVEDLQSQTIIKAQRWLAAGEPMEKIVEWVTRDLANKFMHQPTLTIRQAGLEDDHQLIDAVHTLFDLAPETIEPENEATQTQISEP